MRALIGTVPGAGVAAGAAPGLVTAGVGVTVVAGACAIVLGATGAAAGVLAAGAATPGVGSAILILPSPNTVGRPESAFQ